MISLRHFMKFLAIALGSACALAQTTTQPAATQPVVLVFIRHFG